MKHNIKITIILLAMFVLTQLIGLAVISHYQTENNEIPYGMEPPEPPEQDIYGASFLISFIISFIIAIFLIFMLMHLKSVWFMRTWFFVVVILALGITLTSLIDFLRIGYSSLIALTIAIILAYFKVFKRNILVHNATELMIYPGIASIFVSILNIWTTIILLIIISIYDIWAVWHSGVMQKMAKFQMNQVKVFSGFYVPYANKKMREKIKFLKEKYKNKLIPEKEIEKKKIKVNLAILGGGDIVFPIIASGIFLKTTGSLFSALFVTLGASLGLLYLFVFAEKRKFYPAMPYITSGIFLGMILGWLFSFL